jgi:hypothetical protein
MPEHYSPQPDYDFARNFKGFGEEGLNPKWPNNAKIAVSFVINYEEVNDLTIYPIVLFLWLTLLYRAERAVSSMVMAPLKSPFANSL